MSRPHDPVPPDREVREIQKRIAQQKALVHRMIVQGTPTQVPKTGFASCSKPCCARHSCTRACTLQKSKAKYQSSK